MDNYGYLIVDRATKQCAAVDPADPDLICDMCERRNLTLTMVRNTPSLLPVLSFRIRQTEFAGFVACVFLHQPTSSWIVFDQIACWLLYANR